MIALVENPLHSAANVNKTIEEVMVLEPKGKDRLALLRDLLILASAINLITARWLTIFNSPAMAELSEEDFKDLFYCQRNGALQFLKWDLIIRQRVLDKQVKKAKGGIV